MSTATARLSTRVAGPTAPSLAVEESGAERTVLFQSIEPGDLDTPGTTPAHSMARFSALVIDVVRGVDTVLAIAERDSIDGTLADEQGNALPALLGDFHHGALERLCRASLIMLEREAQGRLDQARAAGGCRA